MAELEAEESWGSLHVYCDRPDAQERIRALVIAAYREHGAKTVEWEDSADLDEVLEDPFIVELQPNPATALGDDEVLVMDEPASGWVAVLSHRWEWAPVARHPLALALSRKHPVLSVTCIAGQYAEYTRYEGGSAVQCSVVGPSVPKDVPAGMAALDAGWFSDKGAVCPPEDLLDAIGDPQRFTALAGPDTQGLRNAFEGAPLDDHGSEQFVVLRVPKRGRKQV